MSNELARQSSKAAMRRERTRETRAIAKEAELAAARAAAVGQLGYAVMLGALDLATLQREATLSAPHAASKFDLITTTAVLGMSQQINRLANQ